MPRVASSNSFALTTCFEKGIKLLLLLPNELNLRFSAVSFI